MDWKDTYMDTRSLYQQLKNIESNNQSGGKRKMLKRKKVNKKKLNRMKKDSIIGLMEELDLVKVKDLESGWNGDTHIVKNNKDEMLILKLERLDSTPSNIYDHDKPNFESEYDRQIDFDNLVAKNHPDKFMVLEKHGIIKDCVFTHSKTDDVMMRAKEKRKNRFIRKNNQPDCYYLLYKPVLDGTFKSVGKEIRTDERLLLDFMTQIISSMNIYRKLGFIHTDVGISNIMFKKINGEYQWYWIDYGNITNNKYPDSHLDIERKEDVPFYKIDMMIDLISLIVNHCITVNLNIHNPKADEKIEFMKHMYKNNRDIHDEIFDHIPQINNPDLRQRHERGLFDLICKILYPDVYSIYYKIEYDNKEQILKDQILLCVRHSNDETYDDLLDRLHRTKKSML